jgi:hypothetical protein
MLLLFLEMVRLPQYIGSRCGFWLLSFRKFVPNVICIICFFQTLLTLSVFDNERTS